MRLFQNAGLYPAYRSRLLRLTKDLHTFAAITQAFLADGYGACHLLLPVISGSPDSFFTNADFAPAQRAWADQMGIPAGATQEDILLAQIEEHRTEVFYNSDPVRFGSDFVRSLPASVQCSVAWRAAPSRALDLSAYNLIVCNFPSILDDYRAKGWPAAYLAPSHDPAMDAFAANRQRPIDLLFVGGYSRHHRRRAELLEKVAVMADQFHVVYRLDASRITKLSETPFGRLLPCLHSHRRPRDVRRVSGPPVFGIDLYSLLSRSKIVFNAAVDMAGDDRGNMRCFEAMGCGALLVSDAGRYPEGMVDGDTISTYKDAPDLLNRLRYLLNNAEEASRIAANGHRLVATRYAKQQQWHRFRELVARVCA